MSIKYLVNCLSGFTMFWIRHRCSGGGGGGAGVVLTSPVDMFMFL